MKNKKKEPVDILISVYEKINNIDNDIKKNIISKEDYEKIEIILKVLYDIKKITDNPDFYEENMPELMPFSFAGVTQLNIPLVHKYFISYIENNKKM